MAIIEHGGAKHAAQAKTAVSLPGIVTEQDREIVARGEAGETRKTICEALGVTLGKVYHAEYVCRRDAEGRKRLAECPDSIDGLDWIGELSGTARDALAWHRHHYEGSAPERMSEVAALGRLYVSRMKGIGPKGLASIDRVLGLLGIAWSPIDRIPKSKPREPERQQSTTGWSDIAARVARLERGAGTSVLEGVPNRDSVDGVIMRLSFLIGYLEEIAAARRRGLIDITPDDQDDTDEDLETAGNLICLPGVRLSDVLGDGGAA